MSQTPTPPIAAGDPFRVRRPVLALLILAAAIALVLGLAVRGQFVYDDLLVVQRNPLLSSLANLPRIFGSSYWDFLDAESAARVGYYRPLTMTLLTATSVVGGGSAVAFHLVSLAVHTLASFAAYLVLSRLTRDERVGLLGALLFALHPVHVESVAWISGVADPLFALFGLLALHRFLRWRDAGSAGAPWGAALWLLFALLSKDAAVAVLPAAVALDLGRSREGEGRHAKGLRSLVRAWAPLLAATLVWYGMRVFAFEDWRAGFDRITTHFGVPAARLWTLRLELLGGFVRLALWPHPLDLFRPFVPELSPGDPHFIAAALAALGWAGACVWAWRRRLRPELALLLLLPAGVAPAVARVQALGTFPLSDRFLYLGVLGWVGLLAWWLVRRLPAGLTLPAALALLAVYAWRDVTRLPFWHDEETLFRTALAQQPRNPNVYWGLGRVLLQRYRHEGDPALLEEARRRFEEGMEWLDEARARDLKVFATKDDHLQMNLGLGWCLFFEAEQDPFHDYKPAEEVFRRVIAAYPMSERGYTGLGAALLRQNRFDEAAEALRTALEINPRSPEALHDMGQLLRLLGELDEAERMFRRAMEIRRDDFQDWMGLAQVLFARGKLDEAADLARRANALQPRFAAPFVLLATIANTRGRFADAERWLQRALELAPDSGLVHFEYAQVLAAQGRNEQALSHYEKAWRERGSFDFQVAYQYGRSLLLAGREEEAVGPLVRAYALRRNSPAGEALEQELTEFRKDDLTLQWSLASVSAQREEWDLAKRWCGRALAIAPQHGPSHYLMGVIERERGEPEAALEHFRDAATRMPDHYYSHLECGTTLLALERPKEALPWIERAATLLQQEQSFTPEQRKQQAERLDEALEKVRAATGD